MLSKKRGFTLIELLVVVVIIGILAAVALPQYKKAVLKSRYENLIVSLKPVYDAWKVNYLETGTYTGDWTKLGVELPGSLSNDHRQIQTGDYSCTLSDGSTSLATSVICSYSQGSNFLDYRIFPSGGKWCQTNKNWALGNDVCKSLGGVDISTAEDARATYNLP